MPRALTPSERSRVLERLHTRGRDRFVRFGLAKTTVAGLAEDAGIGKGSFYQFYASKEALFLAISEREENGFRATLVAELDTLVDGRTAIKALLSAPSTRLKQHPFLALQLDPATISALVLRVDPSLLQANEERDQAAFVALARAWIDRGWIRKAIDPIEVFHALAGLFLIALQRDLLAPSTAQGAQEAIVDALCDRWSP